MKESTNNGITQCTTVVAIAAFVILFWGLLVWPFIKRFVHWLQHLGLAQ